MDKMQRGKKIMQRPRYEKLPDFAVRFMGYSADVIARKGNAIRFGRINCRFAASD